MTGVAAKTVIGLVEMTLSAVPPASAREALPEVSASAPWYAEPLSSLDGRTLAQYVADRQARDLGPVSV